jgi:hypothetical protein
MGPCPVIPVAGESADPAAIDGHQGSVAVIDPALSGRRLRDEGREFGLDKPSPAGALRSIINRYS